MARAKHLVHAASDDVLSERLAMNARQGTEEPTNQSLLPPRQTLAARLSIAVESAARVVDASARISSIARWDHDESTLLRVNTESGASFGVADALRRRWPLATVSVVQDDVNGLTQTQILVPSDVDQRHLAHTMAKESSMAQWLSLLWRMLAMIAVGWFAVAVVLNVALPS